VIYSSTSFLVRFRLQCAKLRFYDTEIARYVQERFMEKVDFDSSVICFSSPFLVHFRLLC